MDARTEERVEGWPSRSFSDGHEGLRELADREFSGVVATDGGAWLCLLNGKAIGVFEGSIDDFEDASGTTYDAPDPALPLLFAMQERGGSVEEEYYTQDTPISEAHETLSSGSFTGYIELSENVLSGDYYVSYYGGRSMSVAFVGSSERLVTGEEAFDRADDEVGIYEVRSVDVEVTEIPGPEPAGDPLSDDTATESGSSATPDAASTAAESSSGGESGPTAATGRESPAATESDPAVATGSDAASTPESGPADEDVRTGAPDEGREQRSGGETTTDRPTEGTDEARASGTSRTSPGTSDTDREEARDPDTAGRTADAGDPLAESDGETGDGDVAPADGGRSDRPDGAGGDRRFRDEAAWRRNQSVPSIADSEAADDRFADLEETLDEHEATIERLHDRVQAVEREASTDRDRLRGGLDELSEDLADLRRTVMRLDQTVDRIETDLDDRIRRIVAAEVSDRTRSTRRGDQVAAESADPPATDTPTGETAAPPDATDTAASSDATAGGTGTTDDTEASAGSGGPVAGDGSDLGVEEALEKTTLLVRYGSQGRPTLKSAHGGGAAREEVNDNLRIDAHTPFDADAATVEGDPYRTFLEGRMEYRFFEWMARDLLYEIRETGNETGLEGLYDAIPRIDRAEMHGSVAVPAGENEEESERVRFDLVARDARGTPLAVANLNDSRDPATQGMVVELNDRATRVREASQLSGAFLVTASYFEGDARETAEDATSGSLLSRDSRKSFVKLSRKRGYHLCLVEANDGGFHVSVPEL